MPKGKTLAAMELGAAVDEMVMQKNEEKARLQKEVESVRKEVDTLEDIIGDLPQRPFVMPEDLGKWEKGNSRIRGLALRVFQVFEVQKSIEDLQVRLENEANKKDKEMAASTEHGEGREKPQNEENQLKDLR